MKKKFPDLKVRVDDDMRQAIEDEVKNRGMTNPEGASVSSVVRDAIRAFLRSSPLQSVSKNSLNLIPRVLPAMPSGEEPLPKKIRKKSAG